MTAILEARGVRKVYRSDAGEVDALAGLLNCLSGLDDIDGGQVLVRGDDIHALSDARRTSFRATGMGFVFQAFHLIPVFSAVENVEIPLVLGGAGPREARRRAAAMLDRVGLGDRTGRRPPDLAGGEQQRVAIARALVADPAIVWADEPTGNLDSATATDVLDLLREVNGAGQTVVIVTHDARIGESCPRLVRMRDGRIEEDSGAPASV